MQSRENMKILCIEDEIDIGALLKDVLEATGHYVTTCDNGLEALTILGHEAFDLVILDLNMPKFSGTDVINSLVENNSISNMNIVILTANDLKESEISEFEQKGIKEFMRKPMSVQGILNVVKKFE